jgi:alpha-N-arabinofuranosidase
MVMSLYRRHSGSQAVEVAAAPDGLDATASRTGDRIFLHVVNTNRTKSVKSAFQVRGRKITGGRAYWFALDPEFEVFEYRPEHTFPEEGALDLNKTWTFPPASVSAVELAMEPV